MVLGLGFWVLVLPKTYNPRPKKTKKMTLSQILTPSIEKAVQALFDIAIDKVEFRSIGGGRH